VTDQTDSQLLKSYAERRHEAAFAELVRRHVDFVYSAALRMARDPHLAEDVTQGVFIALAKQAPELVERVTLTGWLHRTAQNIAAQTVRTITRRRAREQEAVAMNELILTSPEASWEQIEPHLDAALGELSDADRDAVLLRYFQKKSATEIAAIFGVSDAAAQKRVSRAVDRLREFFAKHGVTVGTGGLVVISANAVQSAPVGLAATISAMALTGTAVTTSTIIATTKTIAMTTFQKTLITTTLAVVAGAGVYEAKQAHDARAEAQTLQQQQAQQIQQLQNSFADATNRLADLLAENTNLKSNPHEQELLKLRGEVTQLKTAETQKANDSVTSAAKVLVARVNQLKHRLEQMPEENIPEIQLLSDQDWLQQASFSGDLNTDDELDRALAGLRSAAKQRFAYSMGAALDAYIAANNGQLPNDISDLKSYFDKPVDDAILQRYQLTQAGSLGNLSHSDSLITEKAVVNDQSDTLMTIGAFGSHSVGVGTWMGSGTSEFGTNITAKVMPFARR
jgi:RNA polymerase sigma factor (sigma-70 family)